MININGCIKGVRSEFPEIWQRLVAESDATRRATTLAALEFALRYVDPQDAALERGLKCLQVGAIPSDSLRQEVDACIEELDQIYLKLLDEYYNDNSPTSPWLLPLKRFLLAESVLGALQSDSLEAFAGAMFHAADIARQLPEDDGTELLANHVMQAIQKHS